METAIQTAPKRILDRNRLTSFVADLYRSSSWLTVNGLLMTATIPFSLAGLVLDPTVITGAPAWMKPLKFGISTALFSFTVAWIIGNLCRNPRIASVAGKLLAFALTLEIVLIDMQAARHTTSHFNFTTRFDAYVFMAMGIGISIVLLSTILLFILACCERMADSSLAWTIRLGLLLAILGMGVGSLMTLPTPEELAGAHENGGRLAHVGGHTVGAPDGGPGLPLTGWSADHGDLRIAHFIGLHAMQGLLLAWWLGTAARGWLPTRRLRLVLSATAFTTIAMCITLAQALHGQPLLKPDPQIIATWAICATATAALAIWTYSAKHREGALG